MEHPCPVLPDDIIEDIITRLPAKVALACRGLSRSWAAALSSDAFVDRHHRAANRHNAGPRFFHLTWATPLSANTPFVTTAHAWSPVRCSDLGIGGSLPQLTPPGGWMYGVITQQCRGLVVVDVPGHKLEVYNPSTGVRTALPPRHFTAGPSRHLPLDGRYESLGIGFDARKGQHKVVRIYYRGDKLPVLCEVYVVDGEGFWRAPTASSRLPESRKPAGWVSSYEASVFAQGHVHWMAQKQKPKQNRDWRVTRRGIIVSFSVSDETFGVVPLPPRVDYLRGYQLTALEGRLCLFTACIAGRHRPYDLWLLRDHETGTWDLRCRIDLDCVSPEVTWFMSCRYVNPVATMEDGRRILFMPRYTGSCPCVYTPATGAMEHLPSGKRLIASHTFINRQRMASFYEESVVSPGRAHEAILFSPAATQVLCVALTRCPPTLCELARLKLVCRSWRAVIESDRFIHLSTPSYGQTFKPCTFNTPSDRNYTSLWFT